MWIWKLFAVVLCSPRVWPITTVPSIASVPYGGSLNIRCDGFTDGHDVMWKYEPLDGSTGPTMLTYNCHTLDFAKTHHMFIVCAEGLPDELVLTNFGTDGYAKPGNYSCNCGKHKAISTVDLQRIVVNPMSATIPEGGYIDMTCTRLFYGYAISWHRGLGENQTMESYECGAALTAEIRQPCTASKVTIRISDASQSDSDNYVCKVGPKTSENVKINVGILRFRSRTPNPALGGRLDISCSRLVVGSALGSKEHELQLWSPKNDLIVKDCTVVNTTSSSSRVTIGRCIPGRLMDVKIATLMASDEGQYTCKYGALHKKLNVQMNPLVVTPTLVRALKGSVVKLTCTGSSTVTSPLQWSYNGQLVTYGCDVQFVTANKLLGELKIKPNCIDTKMVSIEFKSSKGGIFQCSYGDETQRAISLVKIYKIAPYRWRREE
ncbi:uncharacterized protein LOC141908257 [Tubulanus polymorphus]|uniref:uncharacterized protein LOC141908257 n=1 Tax=Tubulanus polymorphus TaxID=672921 RepID=UPI003DA5377C